MTVDLIVNPASGPTTRHVPRADRVRLVSDLLRAHGVTRIRATQTGRLGDGTRAAGVARDGGTDLVVVWGGDGTLNEVASALVGSDVRLGIVPGGSGNGFARGLGLPLDVEDAVRVAVDGQPRRIDTGFVSGRTFLNVAGVGFDAAVAARVNTGNVRRGVWPYVWSILDEWRRFETQRFRVVLDDGPATDLEAHLVAVCNGQQYGHGAAIAPAAAFDDGQLDVVVIPRITSARLARHGWRLFDGSLAAVPGVFTARARRVAVSQHRPLPVHVDGEAVPGETSHIFEVRPRCLCVMTRR